MEKEIKLKEYLKKNRWTHSAFAREVGVSRITIFYYVTGQMKPSQDTISKMAKVLNISEKQVTKLF